MKTLTKISLIASVVAAFGATTALADDTQNQNRLARQRAERERQEYAEAPVTIGFYVDHRGIGQKVVIVDQAQELRYEIRTNAHGEIYGLWVPVR